ncbi:MAG: MFS transporter [Candidatus Marinimicrobia bacterium]|nr:MFS transporter [Candidatus Neomarinimicrobiota bacterium]
MNLTKANSSHNFKSFLWHSAFLALASNFMDVDTIIPSMLIKAGGGAVALGLLTAIMLGGSSLFQLLFASFISKKRFKKKYLLIGINLRVSALLLISLLFFGSAQLGNNLTILFIFLLISVFSFSGSYANVSYVDILGKSIRGNNRKKLFSSKQIINSIGILASALVVRELLKYFNYPANYSILFLAAGTLLLIASLGFWRIREVDTKIKVTRGFIEFFTMIPAEIKQNHNLKYYLLTINSLGLGLSMLPFLILLAKENFGLSYNLIGNFLLLRTIGMLGTGLFLFRYSNRFQYKYLLKFSLVLSAALPILSLLFSNQVVFYQLIFILTGIFISVYRVAINGVLLEISNNENRAAYAGISGAGNILTTLFPLFAGALITIFGYQVVFISVSVLISLSYFFVNQLHCDTVSSDDI